MLFYQRFELVYTVEDVNIKAEISNCKCLQICLSILCLTPVGIPAATEFFLMARNTDFEMQKNDRNYKIYIFTFNYLRLH